MRSPPASAAYSSLQTATMLHHKPPATLNLKVLAAATPIFRPFRFLCRIRQRRPTSSRRKLKRLIELHEAHVVEFHIAYYRRSYAEPFNCRVN